MRENSDQVHQFPALFVGQADLETGHRLPAIGNLPKYFPIAHGVHKLGVGEIRGFRSVGIHRVGRLFSISTDAVAFRAIASIESARGVERYGIQRYWIFHLFRIRRHVPSGATETCKSENDGERRDEKAFACANRKTEEPNGTMQHARRYHLHWPPWTARITEMSTITSITKT